jgi:membrane-associated protease RseP (regulator of RpoE activity)
MPAGLRFCRQCGFRLGEGDEEYTATRRFDGTTTATASAQTNDLNHAGAPFQMPGAWGAVAPVAPASMQGPPESSFKNLVNHCNPRQMNWIIWVIVITVVLTIGSLAVQKVARRGRFAPPPPATSFAGVDGFETADGGGAFIEGIAGVGSPVENAGLIGGDIITNFDGQKIEDDDDIRRILGVTPPGKTVDVTFIRDGETKTTKLTTIAEKDFQRLRPLENRPGGQGRIGVDVGDRKRAPGANTYGVDLDDVDRNGPADLAGLKEGDIIIEFNEHPVRTPGDLRYRIYEAVPGSLAKVKLIRGSETLDLAVKVGRSK